MVVSRTRCRLPLNKGLRPAFPDTAMMMTNSWMTVSCLRRCAVSFQTIFPPRITKILSNHSEGDPAMPKDLQRKINLEQFKLISYDFDV